MANGSTDNNLSIMTLTSRFSGSCYRLLASRFFGADPTSMALHKGAAGAFGVQVCGAGLGFIANLVVARLLGAQQYGIYALTLTWISVLLVPAMLGQDSNVVRFLPAYVRHGAWGKARGLQRCASAIVFAASGSIALVGAAAIYLFRAHLGNALEQSLLASFVLLPVLAQLQLSGAHHRALKRAVSCGVFYSVLRPIMLLGIILGLWFWLNHRMDAPLAVWANTVAAAIALVLSSWFLARTWPHAANAARPLYELGTWSSVGARLLLFAAIGIVLNQLDVLVLGALGNSREVGAYYAAIRLASLTSYGLDAVNIILAPLITEHYSARDHEQLAKLVHQAAWYASTITFAAVLVLAMGGYWILDLFGSEFTSAYIPLLILLIGQCVHTAIGPVGYLMTMTRFERQASLIYGGGAILNLLLSILLIPQFGMLGAAIAAVTATIVWKIAALVFVRRHIKVNPTIFNLGFA